MALPTQPYIIETQRLILHEATPEIYNHVFSQYTDAELMEFLGANEEKLAFEKERFEGGLTGYKRSFSWFHLIHKESKKVIGSCGYHNWQLRHFRGEIGYDINDVNLWGKGYMKEALLPIVSYGFNKLGLHRIEAYIGAENTASLRLLLGLGFQQEGVIRKHYEVNGVPEDSLLFSLLKDEHAHNTHKHA